MVFLRSALSSYVETECLHFHPLVAHSRMLDWIDDWIDDWIGLDWIGLMIGLDWIGLDWIGLMIGLD